MKYPFAIVLICLLGTSLFSQRFRPYHAFGAQVNATYTTLSSTREGQHQFLEAAEFNQGSPKFDIIASYDYGVLKWLGVSSGIGFSLRGGTSRSYISGYERRRDLYYLTVPLKLQLKPFQFLWFEGGIESKYFLGFKDVNFNEPEHAFPPEDINTFDFSGLAGLRFNLFRGLSLDFGYHFGLTSVAEVVMDHPLAQAKVSYQDFGYHVGIRYMFNQP